MKLIGLLNKRVLFKERTEKLAGIINSLVFALALMLFCAVFLNMSIVLSGLVFVLIAAAFIVTKLYRVMYNNTVLVHILCAGCGIYCASLILDIAALRSDPEKAVIAAASGIVFFEATEFISGIAMSFIDEKPHNENFGMAVLAVFPLFFTTVIFVPSETFFANSDSFLIMYSDIVPYVLIKTALLTLISAVLLCSFNKKRFKIITRIIAGVTLCAYAQYMFMNGLLPRALGDRVDWNAHTVELVINAVIWVLLALLPTAAGIVIDRVKALKDKPAAENAHNYLSAFIGGMQLITYAVLLFTSDIWEMHEELVLLSNTEQFIVSGNKNIITFIIDMADRNYFDEVYSDHPEKFECLKDFTYYTNACMMYDSTEFSIPQMLTASQELPGTSLTEWLGRVWNSESSETFYSRLHENNYTVNVYGDFETEYPQLVGKIDNARTVEHRDIKVDGKALAETVDCLSAYRWLPLCMKGIYTNADLDFNDAAQIPLQSVYDNREFLNATNLEISESGDNRFIVEHIIGTHEYTGTYYEETLDCLDVIAKYTGQLKELGVYDDSLIIITADHGEHYKPDDIPIWYIKYPGEKHNEMLYSNAPISHSDFCATCLSAAGLWQDGDSELFGRPVSEIAEDEERTRLLFQSNRFQYVGPVDWKIYSDAEHMGALFGYYYTGDRDDLKARCTSAPPDILIEITPPY
ncbi:MAG: hypothetical protein II820_10360 [Ruminiclostridium sp.]|nr:hypothetical protein [Ruminiclostridium sp.]